MRRILLSIAVVIVTGVAVGRAQVTRTDAKPAPQSAKEVRGALPEGGSMPAQTNNLYLLEDLDDASKTKQLAKSDLAALRSVADWIKSFVAKPHKDLGRDGAVCPFVPEAWSGRFFGWLLNTSLAAARQMLSN